MIEKGLKNSVIAEKLQVDRRTVYNWRLRKEREIDWKRRKQKEKLKKIIDDGATACGYPTEVWTLKRIAEEFKRKQGYEMIEKGLKNSVIAEKLQVDRRTVFLTIV